MASNTAETLIGALVLAVAGAFVVYASTVADLGLGGGGSGSYQVTAKFRKAEGIAPGGDVRIAGVKVGSITSMTLDPETYQAKVILTFDGNVQVPDDSSAKITSASLLGDSYVAVDPGASEFMLEAGDEIAYTQGSVSLTDLIGRFIHGGGTE